MSASSMYPRPIGSFRPEYSRRQPGYRTPSPPRDAFEPLSPLDARFDQRVVNPGLVGTRKRRYDPSDDHTPWTEDHWHNYNAGSVGFRGHRANVPGPAPIDTQISSNQQPSKLDIFATIATSPSLAAHQAYTFLHYAPSSAGLPQDSQHNRPHTFERASKRSRSEVIKARPILGPNSRPSTSYIYPSTFSPTSPATHAAPRPSTNGAGHESQSNSPHDVGGQLQDDDGQLRQDAELLLSISRGFGTGHTSGVPPINNTSANPTRSPDHVSSDSSRMLPPLGFFDTSAPEQTRLQSSAQTSTNQSLDAQRSSDTEIDGYSAGGHIFNSDPVPITGMRPPPKPKDHRGWPKGKPRGPRASGAESKRKAKTTKRNTASSDENRLKGKASNRLGPHKGASVLSSRLDFRLSASDTSRRPRRASEPKVVPRSKSDANPISRQSSAPPDVETPTDQPGIKRPRVKKEPQLDICGACNQNRNSVNGLQELWINCNACKTWFHTTCAGFEDEKRVKDVDKFHCRSCENTAGPTTFVRKSSRAHASVDYAGLNEGKIRTADDIPDHHYIEPIKNGTIEFQPETFARLPPELVTQEYFERSGVWTEPVVIPAAMNPRPYQTQTDSVDNPDIPQSGLERSAPNEGIFRDDLEYDCVLDDGQDGLDMVIPEGLTVRQVAELYGPEEKVDVIDVKLQEGEDKRWNMRQWADYYEAEGDKPVRNVISLEVSHSTLGRLIRRPKIVRDLDLQDSVWPEEETAKGVYPKVQFYCLMSVADCYTDFHIDFGGSSVYYHILKGRKTFFFIPPKPKYLKKYEEWCNSPDQNSVFLGNETKECYRVDLYPGDTMLIPSGWIHAVWTPENSLVIGGNFLTRMHYGMQIAVNEVEKATNVTRKFRYPYFQRILWLVVVRYLQEDPVPSTIVEMLCNGKTFARDKPIWLEIEEDEDRHAEDPAFFNARSYSQGELDGLPDLIRYIHRTVVISLGRAPGVPKKTQEAVQRSMPKDCGDHLEALSTFAMWAAWKRGNEEIPAWAYPDAPIDELDVPTLEKKPTTTSHRRQVVDGTGARRTSQRTPAKPFVEPAAENVIPSSEPLDDAVKVPKVVDGRRSACESCRKRRRRCTHNGLDGGQTTSLEDHKPSSRFGIRAVKQPKEEEQEDTTLGPGFNPHISQSASVQSLPVSDGLLFESTPSQWTPRPAQAQYPENITTALNDQETPHSQSHQPASDANTRFVSKPPKSRACEACRKSKVSYHDRTFTGTRLIVLQRRCTHNPWGESNMLPVRESLVNRISSASKRSAEGSPEEAIEPKRIKPDFAADDFMLDNADFSIENDGQEASNEKSTPEANSETPLGSRIDPTLDIEPVHNNPVNSLPGPAQSYAPEERAALNSPQMGKQEPPDGLINAATTTRSDSAAQIVRVAQLSKTGTSDGTHPRTISGSNTDNSRSRTSSLHLRTAPSSSEEAVGSHSPPTSPLTELEPSSPQQQGVAVNSTSFSAPSLNIADPPSEAVILGDTNLQGELLPSDRITTTPSKSPKARRRSSGTSTGTVGKKGRRPSTPLNNSIPSGSTPNTTKRVNGATPEKLLNGLGAASGSSKSPEPKLSPEEEASIKLAKMLAQEDAGLRRRGNAPLRYTR